MIMGIKQGVEFNELTQIIGLPFLFCGHLIKFCRT